MAIPSLPAMPKIPKWLLDNPVVNNIRDVNRNLHQTRLGGVGDLTSDRDEFALNSQGSNPYIYSSGNLRNPDRLMVAPPDAAPAAPDYMSIFNEMLSAMTPGRPEFNFDASPYQAAAQAATSRGQLGQQLIGQTQQGLMGQLAALQDQYGPMAQQNMANLTGMHQGVNDRLAGAVGAVNTDLAAQGVNAQVGGGARAAALAAQQQGQVGRLQASARATLDQFARQQATGTAQGQTAQQNLQANLGAALGGIEQDQLKAQTAAQNDYIRALNSWQKSRAGGAKSVLGMIADALPGDDNIAAEWADKSGPTADTVAESLVRLETGESPETIIGELNQKKTVPKLDDDGNEIAGETRRIDGWTYLREQGVDTEAYKSTLRKYGKPKKLTKQQRAIGAIRGGTQ